LEASPTNKILIHCFAGKSRATSFTLAYLIGEKKMSLKDGLERIWMVRPIAEPNKGFMT
jgi:protein-tyrosine phosphatase